MSVALESDALQWPISITTPDRTSTTSSDVGHLRLV
jgi:hypothetical protein